MKSYLILTLLLCSSLILDAQNAFNSAAQLFNSGNEAYNANKYDEAIYNYEKALLLDPSAEDIKINLQLAIESLNVDIVALEPFFLADWWKTLTGLMLPGSWKIFSILMLIGFCALLYFYLFKEVKFKRKHILFLLSALLLLFFLSIFAGHSRTDQIKSGNFAIVFGADQSLFLGPDEVSDKIKDVTGGVKVKILDASGDWFKVATMDSEQGWIKKESVKKVLID